MGAHFQHGIAQALVQGFQFVDKGPHLLIDQIRLVEHQGGRNVREFCGHQVAIQEGAGRGRQRGEYHQHLLHIGGHGFQVAVHVRPFQYRLPWLDGHHHAQAFAFWRLPDDPVAHHQLLQGGAEMAAHGIPVGAFHAHLLAEMGGDGADLLVAQVVRHQGLQLRVTALGPLAFLCLDFFNAPALAAVELAFGHEVFRLIGGCMLPCRYKAMIRNPHD